MDNHRHLLNFASGGLSGMVGLIISHPFDTMKTCIQNNKRITYSPRFLYRGWLPPLGGMVLEKGLVFGTYESTVQITHSHAVSGALSGLIASFIVTPVERIKILKQSGKPIGTLTIYRLFKGLNATFTREVPGFAIYFTTYNHLKTTYYPENIPPYMSFLFGGLSGAISWVFIYPQDTIKTRIQTSDQKVSIASIIKEGPYRGFSLALMRAIPLHAGAFMTNEILKTII